MTRRASHPAMNQRSPGWASSTCTSSTTALISGAQTVSKPTRLVRRGGASAGAKTLLMQEVCLKPEICNRWQRRTR